MCISEEAYRACHTLSGSSRMAEARHGIRLTAPLEHWVRKSFDSGVGLEAAELDLLADCMNAMQSVASHLDESTGFFHSHSALLTRIDQATENLEQRIIAAARAAEATAAQPQVGGTPGFCRAGGRGSSRFLSASSAGRRGSRNVVEDVVTDFDQEIASIFTDEAVELIEQAQSALAQWNENRSSVDGLTALKRPLHTLKGGARMAGLMPMGDLSHELETLFMQIDSGVVAPDDRAFSLAQTSLDELARMRESVSSGKGVPTANGSSPEFMRWSAAGSAATAARARCHRPVARARSCAGRSAASATAAAPVRCAVAAHLRRRGAALRHPSPLRPTISAVPSPPKPAYVPPPPRVEPVPEPPVLAAVWAPSSDPPSIVTRAAAKEPVSAGFNRDGANKDSEAASDGPLLPPGAVPPGREPTAPADRPELARVDAELLDQLLNNSGEASIARARLEQQIGSIDFNVGELSRTVTRLKEQLRKLELETEAQILHRYEEEKGQKSDFDPLELDRYSSIQQFSRGLAETANDVGSIQQLLENLTKDTQNLLTQQARTITELQNGLMRTRMVPFQRHVQRLARIVRQAATDTHKKAELQIEGASGELDRQVLERMMPPFEHMLRNAVAHGIETPEERKKNGKNESRHHHHRAASRRLGSRGRSFRRRRRHEPQGDPRQGHLGGPGARRSAALRRRHHAARARARLLHGGRGQHAVGPRRRHGRGRQRDQETRRRAAHGDEAGRRLALHHPPAAHARHQPRADPARQRRVVCAAAADGRRRRAPVAHRGRGASRPRSAGVRIRRPEIPLPAPGVLRRARARSAARWRRDRARDPGARRRTFHRPRHRRTRRAAARSS